MTERATYKAAEVLCRSPIARAASATAINIVHAARAVRRRRWSILSASTTVITIKHATYHSSKSVVERALIDPN